MEEEKKEAGIKLTDEEIDLVTGGDDQDGSDDQTGNFICDYYCKYCQETTRCTKLSPYHMKCLSCNKVFSV